ncbi:Uncharacterized membrane protein YjjP, DUF1212 family [Austwickia chelonae]|uniref:Threonine export protein n=2 Tax=Austwickia TaxID=1184606 RepID=K6VNF5_9MICO|nr:hypothetical protein AUCHE_08_05100 [Austwickia chelonae NBRC 105200]SEV99957.1 Uncharacterized membrane protein YjjP, DUF1212 family [Austwickia chelonae]
MAHDDKPDDDRGKPSEASDQAGGERSAAMTRPAGNDHPQPVPSLHETGPIATKSVTSPLPLTPAQPELRSPLDDAAPAAESAAAKSVFRTRSAIQRWPLDAERRTRLRNRFLHAVEGAPPTWGMRIQPADDGVEEARARAVIDLAMRIAEALLTTGSSAADVTATAIQLTHAYGLRSVHVDVTFTSITVSHHRGERHDPVTVMRVVANRTSDFDRLRRIQKLVAALAQDPIPIEEARERFTEIMRRPHLYHRDVVTAANAGLAAAIAALLDGSWQEIVLTLVTAAFIDRSLLWVSRRGLAAFFAQIIGGAIPTGVAVILMYARAHDVAGLGSVSPSVVVTAGIVVLLAGLQLVGAAQDAIDGYYVTATGRGFEVLLMTLGVVVGILMVLGLGNRAGVPAYISPTLGFAPSVTLQISLAGLVSAAFAITTYSGPRTVLVSLLTGALGWSAYLVGVFFQLSIAPASAIGAFAVGALAPALGRICRVPSLAITTAGLVTLLPGGMVYRGLYDYVGAASDEGLATLMSAGTVGLALAAGVSLGTYVGRPMGETRASTEHKKALRRVLRRRRTTR